MLVTKYLRTSQTLCTTEYQNGQWHKEDLHVNFSEKCFSWLMVYSAFSNIPWTEFPVAAGFALVLSTGCCLFHQLTITAMSCSISLQQNTVIKMLRFLNKNYLWLVRLNFIIQKYPQRWSVSPSTILSIWKSKLQNTQM